MILQTNPGARKMEVDSKDAEIKLEWRDVEPGTNINGSFSISSNSVGDYTITPSKIEYELSDRTKIDGTGNSSVVHVIP